MQKKLVTNNGDYKLVIFGKKGGGIITDLKTNRSFFVPEGVDTSNLEELYNGLKADWKNIIR